MASDRKNVPQKKMKLSTTTDFIFLQHQCDVLQNEKTAFFENAPLPMVVLDADKNVVEANKLFRQLFLDASDASELYADRETPVSFEKFISPLFQSTFHHFCRMLQKTSLTPHAEIRMTDALGKDLYVRLTAGTNPMKDRFLVMLNDISRMRQMETQLAYARDRMEEFDRKRAIFLTNISHEIRTPLATVNGYADLLCDPSLTGEQRRTYLRALKNATNALRELTDGILSLNDLENARAARSLTMVDFVEICRETILLFQHGADAKQITFSLDAVAVPACRIDAAHIRQLLFKLLEYAVASSVPGNPLALRVRFVKSDEKRGVLLLNISGKNIFPPEEDGGAGSASGDRSFAGLGMYIAGRIVEKMGGRFVREHPVDSLSVELPNLEYEENAPLAPLFENEEILPVELPKTCLLVDDVLMNLKVMDAMLRKLHYVPTLATSAKDALILLAHNRFDFIMTDLWMPGMNGEEFSMMVRQNTAFKHTPIYAVTADIESASNFNMEFFQATLIKPVTVEKLKTLLQPISEPDSDAELDSETDSDSDSDSETKSVPEPQTTD